MSKTTVRDLEWHMSGEFAGWISAEDQELIWAGRYGPQIVVEHNTYQALRNALVALAEVEPIDEYGDCWLCRPALCDRDDKATGNDHNPDCPWLLACQAIEETESVE